VLSREEVFRLQDLRGRYGIAAPAPICTDPAPGDPAECQVIQAPSSPGQRLVSEWMAFPEEASGPIGRQAQASGGVSGDREIRLTYSELTALIEDAVKNLR
jgi:hypothetical protein